MIASLDRDLKEAGSSISIAKDREFVNSRKVKGKLASSVNRATANVH